MTKKERILAVLLEHPGITLAELNNHLGEKANGSLNGLVLAGDIVRKGTSRRYRHFVSRKVAVQQTRLEQPPVDPTMLFPLWDKAVFAAVKRRQEAVCKA
ncbi:hypothetical protein NB636_01970 [Oxalobacter aliiformigenes]|uniref:hypothetical protein n=1 Tax=Oxalobacter aliiformigenes TaxID=2946593 RepID=UPI0022B05267|nr:hypothetical protein [Oxalobacter aliiformigenes]MCZ4065470.1 hypothetical protein [Oxalobacter aliiformigenes]WAV99654.1 hypothetical protein NB636_01970 [Oxalobacter aliiformigenes]